MHVSVSNYTTDFLLKLRRPNYVTPRHYLDALETYQNLLNERKQYIESQCERLGGGITKIAEASATLDELNAVLAVQKVKVENQTKNCEALLVNIEKNTTIAMSKKSISNVRFVKIS